MFQVVASLNIHIGKLVARVEIECFLECVCSHVPPRFPIIVQAVVEAFHHFFHVRKFFLIITVKDFIDTDCFSLAFDHHLVNLTDEVVALEFSEGVFTDEDAGEILFARAFQAGTQIYAIPDHGVIHPLG